MEVDLDDNVGGRISIKVNLLLRANYVGRLNVETGVGLGSFLFALLLDCRRSVEENLNALTNA